MDNKEYLSRLGERIVRERRFKGLKQIDLAFKVGIEDSALRRIEKGRVNSSILMLRRVAKALEVELSDLVDVE